MPTTVHPDVLDSALGTLSSSSDLIAALTAEPADYAAAVGSSQLVSTAMSGTDFTLGDAASGRQLTVAAKNALVSTSGQAAHIVVLDTSTQRILFSADITPVSLTSGEICQFQSWNISMTAGV